MKSLLLRVILFAVLASPAVLAAGDPRPPQEGVPPGITCGLGAEFHSGRRAALLEEIDEGIVLLRGLPETRGYTPFYQDKVFWYLTGVESPDAALLLDAQSGRQILFLPKIPQWRETWEGERWDVDDAWVPRITGIGEVRSSKELLAVLGKLTAEQKTVWISHHPSVGLAGCYDRALPYDRHQKRDPLDGRLSREKALAAQLEERLGVKVRDCAPIINSLRRVKTAEEGAAMRRCASVGAAAMKEAMRSTRPGLGEWELDAVMSFVFRLAGAAGPAYHAIVGSGPNSLVLHYSDSSRRMADGEVVLIDYAPDLDHYTMDITRTWPVNGHFSPRQAEIYDVVRAALEAGIAAARPGAKISDVETACQGVLQGSGFGHLVRHASCHHVGLEVHDVGRTSGTLEPGVAFAIEPGLYEPETGIGVRIEEVVLITPEGCEVLSAEVPRSREEIEALIAEEGILDRIGSKSDG